MCDLFIIITFFFINIKKKTKSENHDEQNKKHKEYPKENYRTQTKYPI